MSNEKTIAKNTFYMYIRMAITVVVGLYTSRVVLNTLGVADYGIYNVVGGIVTLFIFLNAALSQATQRFIAFELGKGTSERLNKTFCMTLNVHIIIAVMILFFAETVGSWFLFNKLIIPESRLSTAFWVFQISIIASLVSITQVPYNAAINAHEKFNVYAVVSIIDACYRLLIVLALPFFDGDLLLWYAALVLSANLIQAFVYRVYCSTQFQECRFRLYWNYAMFKKIFGFTSWSLIGNVADTLADQGLNMLLNMFFGPAVNAARGVAVHVKTSVSGFVTNFQSAANPQIVKKFAAGEHASMVNLVIKTSKVSFFLFLLIMLSVCVEIDFVLKIWLGTVPRYLPEFCVLILSTVLLQSVGGTIQAAIQASGNIRLYQILVGCIKLCTLPICYLGLRNGQSPIFPFLIVMAIYGGVVVVNLLIARKVMKFPVLRYVKEVICVDFLVFTVSLFFPFLCRFFLDEFDYRFAVTIPSAFLSVFVCAYLIGLNSCERTWIREIIINKLRRGKR